MTNFEFWKDSLAEIAENDEDVALSKGEPVECSKLAGCQYCGRKECSSPKELLKWLLEEHIEKPKLTKKERLFCELVETGWIARDKYGSLYLYTEKPERKQTFFHTGCPCFAIYKNESSPYFARFSFIKWEDSEPWAVEDLLKLEVE